MDLSPSRLSSSPSPSRSQELHAKIMKNDLLLHEAVIKNDPEEVKRILAEPCDVNSRNNYGRAPIHWAASRGNVDLIQMLIHAKCDIEARDKYGMRPLLMTAWHGHRDAMKLLLDAGACINSVNKQQQTLLMCAARNKKAKLEVVELVLKVLERGGQEPKPQRIKHHRASISITLNDGKKTLLEAAKVEPKRRESMRPDMVNLRTMEADREKIPGLNSKDIEGHSALHHAALVGHYCIVQRLATAGADIDSSDKLSRTPLHSSCSGGYQETAVCLLECGANPHAKDSLGDTPLHAATSSQHKDIVNMLLEYGSEPDWQNNKGWTPLHIASSLGCRGTIDCLLQAGASMNKPDEVGNTVLHVACQTTNIDIVELFISRGADLNFLNANSETPMQIAASRGDAATCRALLSAGASSGLAAATSGAGGGAASGTGSGAASSALGSTAAIQNIEGSPLLAAARGSFTAIVDMIIKTARLDCPVEDQEQDSKASKGSGSSVKPIIDLPQRNWRNSQDDLTHLNEEEQMKEVLWRLAYRQLTAGEWKKLAFYWSITEEQMKSIEHQMSGPSCYKEHGYQMLLLWQSLLPSGANQMKLLCEGLSAIGKKGIVDSLKRLEEPKDTKSNGICNCVNCSIT